MVVGSIEPFKGFNRKLKGICAVTADITEKKLSDVRVDEFHSTISHELRTPLTSIKGETDRLIRLVNDLLDIKKIQDGQLALERSEFLASVLLDNAANSVSKIACDAKVKILVASSPVQTIAGDHDRLLQVLINLLSNAVKFSPIGGDISVSVEKVSTDRVRFAVKDCGPGIRENDLPKLFQRFTQLDQSDTKSKGGTGVGLAISKTIVEQHSGVTGVNSTECCGAEFWFEIPG